MGLRRNYIQKTTGRKVYGVTTILNIMAKPALIWWGYKQGLINYEELSQAIAKMVAESNDGGAKAIPLNVLEKTITEFQVLGLYEKRDEAATAGTLGHAFVENDLRGLADPSTKGFPKPVVEKAEGCFLTFLDWKKSHKLKVHGSEVQLISEKHPFGGTIDHVISTSLTSPPDVEILDIKTGKDIYLEAKIQVGTYGPLWEEHHPKQRVKGYHILRLGPDGEFTHKFFPDLKPYFQQIFIPLLGVHYALKDLGERL